MSASPESIAMEERENGAINDEKMHKEVPQLIEVLKEMKEGLDNVTSKVQALISKVSIFFAAIMRTFAGAKIITFQVKAKQFPTEGGISYLEAKHLLLVNYCQSIVYYLLRKAKGLSIEGHPVVRSLVEIRLFLEKIRPIDKKCGYRIERLLAAAASDAAKAQTTENTAEATQKSKDLLRYRPNPEMLVSKTDMASEDDDGLYRPPKIAPTTMEEDKKTKQERDVQRKAKDLLRRARQSEYVRSLLADVEERPEEAKEIVGPESKELSRYIAQYEKRERQEEEIFNRAPITKAEKKKVKSLLKHSNGLRGLADDFYDEIKTLPLGDTDEPNKAGFGTVSSMKRQHKKRKVRDYANIIC
ncbi:hypothetical protein Cgig2_004727 [Carnegiea gigantea]|uniref:Neuroguidin n=1 Tax=Carnegiea gigantea TaxID=171969 RepID=A0A9Q1QS39_9CARY|nr:hypothetical protein Cgig2_004727 [Carnegiea gigantea]